MKKSLLAIALAITSITAQAGYVYQLPLEVAGGGALANGSITFGNGGAVTPPVEPSEPTIPDPFEPEDSRCDPMAQTYPENSMGREDTFWAGIYQPMEGEANGPQYEACKLKDTGNPDLLARFQDGISYPYYSNPNDVSSLIGSDNCNANNLANNPSLTKCSVSGVFFNYRYKVERNGLSEVIGLTPQPIEIMASSIDSGLSLEEVGKVVVDGKECSNWRNGLNIFQKPNGWMTCDYNVPYETIVAKMGKAYIVEIYRK